MITGPKLPTYVEYGPRESSPPPFQSKGGRFLFCDLNGDIKKIKKMCEDMLNGPAEGRVVYEPRDNTVVLILGTWHGLASLPMVTRGQVNELQVGLMVPLTAKRRGSTTKHEVAMLPYVFVDNPLSLINGREDYGYQKALAKFDVSAIAGENVRVSAYGGKFDRASVADWAPVLAFEPVGREPAKPGPGETPEAVAQTVSSVSAKASSRTRANIKKGLVNSLLGGEATQVFLKQFRDAEQAGFACYQEVVEVPVKLSVTSSRTLFGKWKVTVDSLNSHPITDDLGVKTQTVNAIGEFLGSLELKPGHVV
jgi:hypothetical protein